MHASDAKLLLVEDDAVLRLSLTAILSKSGFCVDSAADGFAALVAMRTQVPHILVSDLEMPGMSGFELLSVVRRRFPATWVVAMSGAFSGSQVPASVVADAFHSKGDSILSLLTLVKSFAQRVSRPALQSRGSAVPVWVHETLRTLSGAVFIILPCPECLRTFPQAQEAQSRSMYRTACFYCGTPITYSVVQPKHLTRGQPSRRLPTRISLPETQAKELGS